MCNGKSIRSVDSLGSVNSTPEESTTHQKALTNTCNNQSVKISKYNKSFKSTHDSRKSLKKSITKMVVPNEINPSDEFKPCDI